MTESRTPATICVELESFRQTIKVPSGTLIMDALRSFGIEIYADCGGKGICGQCRVKVSGKSLPAPGAAGRKLLSPAEQHQGIRLACCTPITDDIKIQLSEKMTSANVRLQVDGLEHKLVVDPVIRTVSAPLPQDDRKGNVPIGERIAVALKQAHDIDDLKTEHHSIDAVLAEPGSEEVKFNACLRGRELIAVLPESAVPVGLALDLGTTKVAGYLMDLTTGQTLAAGGIVNPQGRFGADIMTRLQHACNTAGQKDLSQVMRTGLDKFVHRLADSADVDPHQVVDACIVANTAMVHLLLELPVQQLVRAPYTPASRKVLTSRPVIYI